MIEILPIDQGAHHFLLHNIKELAAPFLWRKQGPHQVVEADVPTQYVHFVE